MLNENVFGHGIYGVYLKDISEGVYVGKTISSFLSRFSSHKSSLTNYTHYCKKLQEKFNIYGQEELKFFIIENCITNTKEEHQLKEEVWIKIFKSKGVPILNKHQKTTGKNLTPRKTPILYKIIELSNSKTHRKNYYIFKSTENEEELMQKILLNTKNVLISEDIEKYGISSFVFNKILDNSDYFLCQKNIYTFKKDIPISQLYSLYSIRPDLNIIDFNFSF